MGAIQKKFLLATILLAAIYLGFVLDLQDFQFGVRKFLTITKNACVKIIISVYLLGFFFVCNGTDVFAQINPAPATSPTATSPTATPDKPVTSTPTITLYGFIRNDMNYDTRQNFFVREGQLGLYPKDIDTAGMGGVDVNKKAQLNLLGILTRLGVKVSGPDAFGAKTTAVIEGDFFGQADVNIGLLRLRHGYVKLEWKKSALTLGQTWYPLFIPECFPGVVNFNTGIPIAPFGWAAQIKYTAKLGAKTSLSFTAYKPREFSVPGVSNTETTNSASMNAVLPELNAHLQYKSDALLAGAQLDFSSIMPYIKYGSNPVKISKERVNAFTVMAYTKITGKKLSIKAMALLGQNTAHWVMMGGYYGYKANANAIETYKPAKSTAAWLEVYSNNKKVSPGLFIGYTVNGGAADNATAAYGRMVGVNGRGIKDLFRVAPRMDICSGKLKFGTELEYTSANYGTRGNNGKVANSTSTVHNTRLTFSTIFNF